MIAKVSDVIKDLLKYLQTIFFHENFTSFSSSKADYNMCYQSEIKWDFKNIFTLRYMSLECLQSMSLECHGISLDLSIKKKKKKKLFPQLKTKQNKTEIQNKDHGLQPWNWYFLQVFPMENMYGVRRQAWPET